MKLQELGLRIQAAREEKRLSQEQLAGAIGCSQSALSNYEKGKRRIYLSQLEKLAEVLEKPFEYFLAGGEPDEGTAVPPSPESNPLLRVMTAIHELEGHELLEVEKYIGYLKWQRRGEVK